MRSRRARQSGNKIQSKRGGRENARGRAEKTRSERARRTRCVADSVLQSSDPNTFRPHPLRPLQTRPPPRIELSVQISILTANLPANSPLLLVALPRFFSIGNFHSDADSFKCCKCSPAVLSAKFSTLPSPC